MNWIEGIIAKQFAKKVRRYIEMNGFKTKAAGIGAILGGAALAISGLVGDKFDFESIKQGVAGIITGLGMLGIGHKLAKLTDAVNAKPLIDKSNVG